MHAFSKCETVAIFLNHAERTKQHEKLKKNEGKSFDTVHSAKWFGMAICAMPHNSITASADAGGGEQFCRS
jgi:hypothetical protein